MHDTIRARIRSVLDVISAATRLLPRIGFGRAKEPPTEPIHRSYGERTPAPGSSNKDEHSDGRAGRPVR